MSSASFRTTMLFTCIHLCLLFIILWITHYSGLNIINKYPDSYQKIYTLLIVLTFNISLFLLQRQLINIDADTSVANLIASSFAATFSALLVYQFVRQVVVQGNLLSDKAMMIFGGSLLPAMVLTLFASSTALRLKKVHGLWSKLPLVIIVLLAIAGKKYIPHLEW